MNLNFPPIVSQEFFIDTGVDVSGVFLQPLLATSPPSEGEWLRDIWSEHDPHVGANPSRPFHFDTPNLGNEGELLSITAAIGDPGFRDEVGNTIGSVTRSSIKNMRIFFGAKDFNEMGPDPPGARIPFFSEHFSTPVAYERGSSPWPGSQGQLGMGIVWRNWPIVEGGPHNPRTVFRIKITARRYR